jgi:autotransporter-associated beta strand protein
MEARKSKTVMRHSGLIAFLVLTSSVLPDARAGSATWNLDPIDNNWNNADNWTPATVPASTTDVATFGASNVTTVLVEVAAYHPLAEIVFRSGASAFTFNVTDDNLVLLGAGITNSSGAIQNFAISEGQGIGFHNSATAGDQTNFILAPKKPFVPGVVFYDATTAGSATFTINGSVTGDLGGEVQFITFSSAASGRFSNLGGNGTGSEGGLISFHHKAKGGNGTFINEGGVGAGALGASTLFTDTSDAENATLIANGGVAGGGGASITFLTHSSGGEAQVELFGNGTLDIHLAAGPITVGSLEGDGLVSLGRNNLILGGKNLNTNFSGVIQDDRKGGSITKVGTGRLILTNASTYIGGTTIEGGTLLVNNTAGSGVGTGPVQALSGILGGSGVISGRVTMGSGGGTGVTLGPGANSVIPGTLTIEKQLALKPDATYRVTLNSNTSAVDQLVANGVRIIGAEIVFNELGSTSLPTGVTLTVISNTSSKPISGMFRNLPDGETITVGNNTLHASYSGGDENDLTLTVVR